MLTDEQKQSRVKMIEYYDETRFEILELIKRDIENYEKYFIDHSKKNEIEFCNAIMSIIGDDLLVELLYNYFNDVATYKEYLLYFTLNEEYEKCVGVQYLLNSLSEHINHILNCSSHDDDVRNGLHLLFTSIQERMESQFNETYGL